MKTLSFVCGVLLLIMLVSCEKNSDKNPFKDQGEIERKRSLLARYDTAKKIAKYHSDALRYTYGQLEKSQELRSKGNLRALSAFNLDRIVGESVVSFFKQDSILLNMDNFRSFKIPDIQDAKSASSLRTSDLLDCNANLKSIMSFLFKTTDQISHTTTGEKIIDLFNQAILSDEFAFFSEEEQNQLLIMFSIFIDSAQYWDAHLVDWCNLFNPQIENAAYVNLRIGGDSEISTNSSDELETEIRWFDEFKELVLCDVIGAAQPFSTAEVGAVVGSAVGGGIAGLGGGLVGAGLGAVGGATGAGITIVVSHAASASASRAGSTCVYSVVPKNKLPLFPQNVTIFLEI